MLRIAKRCEVSWGTETSYYPEEEKISMIPLVAVSEKGLAQTSPSGEGLQGPAKK